MAKTAKTADKTETTDKKALSAEIKRINEFKSRNRTFFWEPYPWQKRGLEALRSKNTVAEIATNKIGKCLTYSTLIDTPNGEIPLGTLFENHKSFDVYAWDGEKKVIAKAHAPFKKRGLHQCYRITMSDGRWIEGADHHRILTENGWTSIQDGLLPYFQNPLPTNSGVSPLTHLSDVGSSTGKLLNYRDDYSVNPRQYGGQPHFVQDNGRVFVPLQDGVQRHGEVLLRKGVQVYRHTNIHRLKSFLLSSWNDLRRNVNHAVESLNQIFYTILSPSPCLVQGVQLPFDVASSYSQLNPEVGLYNRYTLPSYSPPVYINTNHIISINSIGVNSVYDFEVEKYHNYFAGGLIHHNTAKGANTVISWALGYEPWTQGYDSTLPDAIEVGGQWYRCSSLGIKPPVDIVITGEDWKAHLGRTIVGELKKWAPEGWYTTKKNEQGVEYYWEWFNKSRFIMMCYTQDDDLFESFRCQAAWEDEPPPKSKHVALSRGLLLDNGKTLMTLTPIKEAWILDDIVLSGRRDVGIIDGLSILDNPDLVKSEKKVLTSLGLDEKQIKEYYDLLLFEDAEKKTPVSDQGHRADDYLVKLVPEDKQGEISKLKILKFIKDIDPSDVPPRVFGQFKSLVGRVLKEFDANVHVIKPFDVPTDWPVVPMIDFHLSTPQAITYWTVNKQDIKYVIGEKWKNLNAEGIADDIIRKMKFHGWKIEDAFIDPLSKGDTAYMRNALGTDIQDTFSQIEAKLSEHGITLHVASKDKDSGIKNLQTWLKGVNGLPTMYVFEDCERWLFEVMRWTFDDNGKPAKDGYDHMMENSYRFALTGTKYEDYEIAPLPTHVSSGGSNDWMRA